MAASSLKRCCSLDEIDNAVSERLGPTRVSGNAQPACFNRQIAMYLARHVGDWSTTAIGRFYNGRDHSTVCHSIQRVEALRETTPEVDALLADLKRRILENDDSEQRDPHEGSLPISDLGPALEQLVYCPSHNVTRGRLASSDGCATLLSRV